MWFDSICQRRLRGLVSHHRRKGVRPAWIGQTLWQEMQANWATEAAQDKSTNASQNRKSQRDGLGIYKHVGGPRSYAQIKRDKEASLGRPVGIGEVFIETHTRKDGTFVDEKAKRIADAFNAKVQAKINELLANDPSFVSDGTSKLAVTEMDQIFLESTIQDDRGTPFGLGRIAQSLGSERDSRGSSSAVVADLQEQLKVAKKMIEDQELENQRTKSAMDKMYEYMRRKDPGFEAFMQSSEPSSPAPGNGSNEPELSL